MQPERYTKGYDHARNLSSSRPGPDRGADDRPVRGVPRARSKRHAAQRAGELRAERRQRRIGLRLGRDGQSRHRRHCSRHQCQATADAAVAVGSNANASSIAAMAFGLNTVASNQGSVAVGQGATSSGNNSTALGFAARAFGGESVALGDTATAGSASANFSTAIGSNTAANFASSTALGFGAQTTAANQMMFGTATNIYAFPGVNSPASHAAQKPPLLMLTVDANGHVSTARIPTCQCRR
jgi:hypothetical protein